MVAPLLPSEVHSNQSDLQQTLKATQLVTVIRHWRESPRCSGAEEGEGVMGVLWICACSRLAGFSCFTSVVFEFF